MQRTPHVWHNGDKKSEVREMDIIFLKNRTRSRKAGARTHAGTARNSFWIALCTCLFLLMTGPLAKSASACTAADFGAVVDETATALRDLNAAGAQRFQEKLKSYQQKYDLNDSEMRARAAAVQDDKMSDFNREIISGSSDAYNVPPSPSASKTDPVSASPQMAFVTPTEIVSSRSWLMLIPAICKDSSSNTFGSRWI
jgi:hypothetical protein